jgi:hypothetical protein
MVNDGRLPESKGAIIADATEDPAKQMEMAASPLSRDEMAAAVGRKRKVAAAKPEERQNKVAVESKGVKVVVSGKRLGIHDLVNTLTALLSQAKKCSDAGQSLKTFQSLMADLERPKDADRKAVP